MTTTVTLTQAIFIGGVRQNAGATITVDDSFAGALISENKATRPADYGIDTKQFAEIVTNPATNRVSGIINPKTGELLDFISSSELTKYLTKPSVKRGKRGLSALFHELTSLARMSVNTVPILTARLGITAHFTASTWAELNTAITNAVAGQNIVLTPNCRISMTAALPTIAVGVSIYGSGNSRITSANVSAFPDGEAQAFFKFISAVENTNGNQTVRFVEFDGNAYEASNAIYVQARSNVTIRDCEAVRFRQAAVTFNGKNNQLTELFGATAKTTGNGVYNCHFIDCSGWFGVKPAGYASGIVQWGSQKGFELKDSVIIAKGRGSTNCGYGTKPYLSGFTESTLIDNCSILKDYNDATPNGFLFAIETWHDADLRITGSRIEGNININGCFKSATNWGCIISECSLGADTWPALVGTRKIIEFECGKTGIDTSSDDVLIINNYARNAVSLVHINQRDTGSAYKFRRYAIVNNKVLNACLMNNTAAGSRSDRGMEDVIFYKNTSRNTMTDAWRAIDGIKLPGTGQVSRVYVIENQIAGYTRAPVVTEGQMAGATLDVLVYSNNNFHDNGNTNLPLYTLATVVTPSNVTTENATTVDPLWRDAKLTVQTGALWRDKDVLRHDIEAETFAGANLELDL